MTMKWLLSLLVTLSCCASGANLEITCDPPILREDGTVISTAEIAGYDVVYLHLESGAIGNQTVEGPTCEAVLVGVPDGAIELSIATVDQDGSYSGYVRFVVGTTSVPGRRLSAPTVSAVRSVVEASDRLALVASTHYQVYAVNPTDAVAVTIDGAGSDRVIVVIVLSVDPSA